MKRYVMGLSLLVLCASSYAQIDPFERLEPQRNSSGSSYSSPSEVEARRQFDYDPSARYRGTVDPDGSVRMRNYQGDTLRGTIDSDGYGRVQDSQGNPYQIKP